MLGHEGMNGANGVKSEHAELSFNLLHDLALVWPCFDLKDNWSFNQYSGKAYFEEMRIVLTVSEL